MIPFYFVEIKWWVPCIFFSLIATLNTGMCLFSEIQTSVSDGCLQSAKPAKFLILYCGQDLLGWVVRWWLFFFSSLLG